jgi:Cu(I)/Ag(I) efflux system membrane protein CusA/SilA
VVSDREAPRDSGPVARVIALCARNRSMTLLAVAAAFAWAVYALRHTPLDAIPDLSDVQ